MSFYGGAPQRVPPDERDCRLGRFGRLGQAVRDAPLLAQSSFLASLTLSMAGGVHRGWHQRGHDHLGRGRDVHRSSEPSRGRHLQFRNGGEPELHALTVTRPTRRGCVMTEGPSLRELLPTDVCIHCWLKSSKGSTPSSRRFHRVRSWRRNERS